MNEGMQEVISIVLGVEKRFAVLMREHMLMFEKRLQESIKASESRVMSAMNDRLVPIERRLTSIEEIVSETREDLSAGLQAIDAHALQLMDHHKRIRRLEKRMA